MYTALLVTFVVLHIILSTNSETLVQLPHFEGTEDFRQDKKVIRHFKMRCSRRYSPGVCASQLSPVWTFVLQELNCTERLGCANVFRSNRFKNYKTCMQQCQGLVDMYLQMLGGDSRNNDSVLLRMGEEIPSRVNSAAVKGEKPKHVSRNDNLFQEEIQELTYDDYEQGEYETHSIVYKDLLNTDEDIFPHDVDAVDGEIRSQYDLLHP